MKRCLLPFLLILCAGKPITHKDRSKVSPIQDKVTISPFSGKHLPFIPIEKTRQRPGKDFALFFAVNDYLQETWPDLPSPIRDAEEIAKDLRDLYDFETEIVPNPTMQQIRQKLSEYRNRNYSPDAQLLIFFSGHGQFINDLGEGFFIPSDGRKDDPYQDSYLSYSLLKHQIDVIPCRHILLSIDACYGSISDPGLAYQTENPGGDFGPALTDDRQRNYRVQKILGQKSRILISAGDKNRNVNNSEFASQWKEALKNRGGSDGLLDFFGLYHGFLRKANPEPHSEAFGDNEQGANFVFAAADFHIPKSTGIPDRDGDGVPDYSDKCPDQRGTIENNGCAAQDDRDGDGIPDARDPCPNQYGLAKYHGCPDTDGDGIPDNEDRCPTEKGLPAQQGCPQSIQIRPFPWPPPRCAERYTILQDFKSRFARLSDVDKWICSALDQQGYASRSYYSLPNGFALVTRMEQFNKKNGQCLSEAKRWVEYPVDDGDGGIIDYLSSIILPRIGVFRVFVFAVTDQPTGFSDKQVDRAEVQTWLEKGVSVLPAKEKSTAVTDQHFVDVLVYEFETQDSNLKSKRRCPCGMLCPAHLERSGLKQYLH